jgi:hypothetical protein
VPNPYFSASAASNTPGVRRSVEHAETLATFFTQKRLLLKPTQMRRQFLIYLCCFCLNSLSAQNPDNAFQQNTTPSDTVPTTTTAVQEQKPTAKTSVQTAPDTLAIPPVKLGLVKRFFGKQYPSPRTAALLSFVLPGAGQAYNKKWWKIPLVYGALGGMTWLAVDNGQQYQALKQNYKWLVDGDPITKPTEAPYIYMNAAQMKGYRDQYRGFSEKSYLFLGITYLLTVTDAFVDAHLSSFDVSDDLSLHVEPDIQSVSNGFGACFGVGVQLDFGYTKTMLH